MFSAADLIHALQRRLQLVSPHLRRPPGEFPPGWQAWFASLHERIGAVRGATAEAFIAVFLARPLAVPPPKRVGDLTRWQSFATLWRQDWHGDVKHDRIDRRVHWFATAFTVLWHIFFAAMLLYLMYLRFMAVSALPPQGEEVVMIEYVGKGTPKEPGGGPGEPGQQTQQPQPRPQQQAAATPAEQTAASAPPSPPDIATPAPAVDAPAVDAPVPDVAQREVPEPQVPPPAPAVEQPVVVSEPAPSEPTVFVLPPTRRRPPEAAVAAPELRSVTPTVRTTEVAEPVQPIRPNITPREVAAPSIDQRQREVAVREVPAPLQLPPAPVRTLPTPTVPTPVVRSTAPGIRTAEIPTPPTPAPAAPAPSAPVATAPAAPAATNPSTSAPPAPGPAAPASTSASTAPAAVSGAPGANQARPAAPAGSGTQPVAGAGAGPKPAPAAGTWSTPTRGDDWGESTRNRPGGQRGEQPGLYNSDGSVRIADAPGSASPGQPPGTITEEIKDLDRAGTWLRRKPNDFEPTSFEKYWVPNESLLAEWVRKGVRKVAIPIPGTGKSIECVISMLALGGGCGISDPNLNDQPAGARPPPPVPFKPALQEDNGSVKPPPGG